MPADPFAFHYEPQSEHTGPSYLRLKGFLDANGVGAFERAAEAALGSSDAKLILDLEQLNYISSAGIGCMMALLQQLRRRGGDMVVIHPAPKVHHMLELLGFTTLFEIVGDRGAAIHTLRQVPRA